MNILCPEKSFVSGNSEFASVAAITVALRRQWRSQGRGGGGGGGQRGPRYRLGRSEKNTCPAVLPLL